MSPPDGLARAGLLARGFVYAVIGVLALEVALGEGGKTTTQQGALKTVAKGGFGKVLLIVLAIGLAGYALWRLSKVLPGKGDDDLKERVSALAGGITYGALCVTAVQILVGAGASSSSGANEKTGGVFDWPAGRVLVGLVGLIVIGVGVNQLVEGVKRSFLDDSRTGEMSEATEKAFTTAGVIGYCARGVVFGLIGVFLIKAAIEYDPKEAVGLDGALAKVAHATGGPVLLGIVALGLLAFALYCFADARYRDLDA